jgi:nucleoside phosphorylase
MSSQGRIPTYFSHSYWAQDRDINKFFWELFWQQGFSFTVDPESDTTSIPHLELMMRWSACFVAVVTHRPAQPFYKSSPFIAYEYGLAVRAQKPRLVFLETGVPNQYFSEASVTAAFDRRRLDDRRGEFADLIEELAAKSRAYSSLGDRPRGPAGLMLPPTRAYRQTRDAIGKLLKAAGHGPREVGLSFDNSFEFALELDACDFVVLDVGSRQVPSWIYPFLQGRFIPVIRLLYQDATGRRGKFSSLLDDDDALQQAGVNNELFIRWSTPDELKAKLERQVEKLFQPREPFRSEEEGRDYFNKLGRRHVSMFISNAGPDNEFASRLVRALQLANIKPFHYVYQNPFELGRDWRDCLQANLQSTQLFVPLISRAYWDSDWCKQEYETAERLRKRSMLTIYPYFLDDMEGPVVPPQGRRLWEMQPHEQIPRIVEDIDDYLTAPESSGDTGRAEGPMDRQTRARQSRRTRKPAVDIAIVTVLPEEYQAVYEQLERRSRVPGTRARPNLYSWELGEIGSEQYGRPYRIVLALAGRAGEGGGLLTVIDTLQAFTTNYMLLVGIAGGLGGLRKGDVVVSDLIYGYEYGKIDGGYKPRPDWTFSADLGFANAARTMPVRNPNWANSIRLQPPEGDGRPAVQIAPIASGNKVVDDLSDPSFKPVLEHWPKLRAVEMEGLGLAQAIERARENGLAVNFSMVRGISDLPRRQPSETVSASHGGVSTQTQERDAWKKYASEAAAVLTSQIIRHSWREPPREA